jgi:hypothetical protein
MVLKALKRAFHLVVNHILQTMSNLPIQTRNQIAGLESIKGMLANRCFNGQVFYHVSKALSMGLNAPSIGDKKRFVSWLVVLLQEMGYKTIYERRTWSIQELGDRIKINTDVRFLDRFWPLMSRNHPRMFYQMEQSKDLMQN